MNQYDYNNLAPMRLCPESNGKLATGRTNLPADRWYTSVLPIPTVA